MFQATIGFSGKLGIGFNILGPFAGLAALAWLGGRALVEHRKARKLIRSA